MQPRTSRIGFDLAQLTKHMAVANLTGSARATDPYEVLSRIVQETLRTYLTGMHHLFPGAPSGVREVAKGAMSAVLAKGLELSRGTVAILKGVEQVAASRGLDPTELQTWAFEGIAAMWRFIPHRHLEILQTEIELAYSERGHIFRELLEKREAPPSSLL